MKFTRPLLVLAAATLSCQVILGLEEPQGNVAETPIAPSDAGEGGTAVDPCAHQRPPPPPAKDDDLETKQAYWLAAMTFDSPLKPDAGVKPGFDLDNSCTCQPDLFDGGPSCRTPSTGTTCDFPNGVDDAFGNVAGEFVLPSASFDPMEPLNRQLREGIRTLLLYLKDYNGKANDSDVGVEFINSGGLYTNLGCDGKERANKVTFLGPDEGSPGTRYAPLGDGCDRWSPAEGTTIGMYPNRVPPRVGSAYVSNFDLVVTFRETGASLFGGATKLGNGALVARLSKDGNGKLRASGIMSGRIAFTDLLDLVGRTPVDNPADGGKQPFCNTAFWTPVTQRLCSARDVMVSTAEERLGKTCDATSASFAFTLVQAEVSDVTFGNPQTVSTCQSSSVQCPP